MFKKYYTQTIILLLAIFMLSFVSAQCVEDSHTSFKNQGWTSCKTSNSPNEKRGKSHWIQYDLGSEYQLSNIRIWNHNVWGETGQGVKSIILDYSLDGENWASAGKLTIQKAPGSWKYVAPDPIDLNGLSARFVLINVIETWEDNSDCAGIAELSFGVESTTHTDDREKQLNQFKIYPNPASEHIRLEFEDQETKNIRIVNSVGQIVAEMNAIKKATIDFSIIDLKDGLYYIKVESENMSQINSFSKFKN